MEHTKAYQEYKKNGNTKFVRYSEGAEMYHMSVSKFMQMAKDAKAVMLLITANGGLYPNTHRILQKKVDNICVIILKVWF